VPFELEGAEQGGGDDEGPRRPLVGAAAAGEARASTEPGRRRRAGPALPVVRGRLVTAARTSTCSAGRGAAGGSVADAPARGWGAPKHGSRPRAAGAGDAGAGA
jgi:hypothetical protein